jgi:hypothetical protein
MRLGTHGGISGFVSRGRDPSSVLPCDALRHVIV